MKKILIISLLVGFIIGSISSYFVGIIDPYGYVTLLLIYLILGVGVFLAGIALLLFLFFRSKLTKIILFSAGAGVFLLSIVPGIFLGGYFFRPIMHSIDTRLLAGRLDFTVYEPTYLPWINEELSYDIIRIADVNDDLFGYGKVGKVNVVTGTFPVRIYQTAGHISGPLPCFPCFDPQDPDSTIYSPPPLLTETGNTVYRSSEIVLGPIEKQYLETITYITELNSGTLIKIIIFEADSNNFEQIGVIDAEKESDKEVLKIIGSLAPISSSELKERLRCDPYAYSCQF